MDVRPLRPESDEELARWHRVLQRAWLHERPWESVPPVRHYARVFANRLSSEANEGFAAYDGDELVGVGSLCVNLDSNTDKVEFQVAVPPERRSQGVGTALVEHALGRAREAGATVAITSTSYPFERRETHPFRRFAEARGFALDLDEVHRVLALPVDPALLEKLADHAATRHEGYRIETWVDGIPEPYVDSYLFCSNQLPLDAPMGAVEWTEGGYQRATFEEEMAFLAHTGRSRYTSVAISADEEVVAYTDLVLRADGSGKVSQWGTLVRRDHRGHRLGTAVKAANIAALQQGHPDATEIHTTNAEVNDAMIAINDALGFRPVAVQPCFYRSLR